MEFVSDKPTVSALYLVDRDKLGKWYRWYNADTDQWGACGIDMNEAIEGKDNTTTAEILGFFPWCGPLTGPNFKTNKRVVEVVEAEKQSSPIGKKSKRMAKKMAKQRGAKLVVSKVGNTTVGSIVKPSGKTVHPDGTVFFRADRQKWVAVWAGKQEAARPTAEACLAFLKKKYDCVGTVLNKE